MIKDKKKRALLHSNSHNSLDEKSSLSIEGQDEKGLCLQDKIHQFFAQIRKDNLRQKKIFGYQKADLKMKGFVQLEVQKSKEDEHNKIFLKFQIHREYIFNKDSLIVTLTDVSDQVEADYQKELNKRTNTVIASMTHELRTPLNGIIGL